MEDGKQELCELVTTFSSIPKSEDKAYFERVLSDQTTSADVFRDNTLLESFVSTKGAKRKRDADDSSVQEKPKGCRMDLVGQALHTGTMPKYANPHASLSFNYVKLASILEKTRYCGSGVTLYGYCPQSITDVSVGETVETPCNCVLLCTSDVIFQRILAEHCVVHIAKDCACNAVTFADVGKLSNLSGESCFVVIRKYRLDRLINEGGKKTYYITVLA